MNRLDKIPQICKALARNQTSIGSWMQTPNTSVAEIMGQAGYDWVAVDMEPGTISVDQLLDCSVRWNLAILYLSAFSPWTPQRL